MISKYFIKLGRKTNKKEKRNLAKNFFCLSLVLIFLLNFFCVNEKIYQNADNEDQFENKDTFNEEDSLGSSGGIPLLQDPFTINFSKIRNYFNTNFKSDLNYDVSTYIRDLFSNNVFSEDNLLLYKTLEKENYDETKTFNAYIDLMSTPLWYENVTGQYEYGFIKSIDGTTGDITNGNRSLIDNLMPIFLILENVVDELDTDFGLVETPKQSLDKFFYLINSTVFRDNVNGGFLEYNSSVNGQKYTKSNLYSILANLMIHKYKYEIADASISDLAFNLASQTMTTLVDNMWDNKYKGFIYRADSNWDKWWSGPQGYKYLDVNALGIIALIEYWVENGMDNNSLYFQNATLLYDKINTYMWNTSDKAYKYCSNNDWGLLLPEDERYDLEANALMMEAILKLFEVTGEISYYERALELYNTFENKMYDNINNAYNSSIGTLINNNKNFTANLRLSEAYLKALDIYTNTRLDATFNTTNQIPDLVMNQDVLNLTCDYAFEKTISFTKPTPGTNTTRYDNITDADITYIFYYPNLTVFDKITKKIVNKTISLLYSINETLPLGDGYSIIIYANTTYFSTAFINKSFNIISGLENKSLQGLEEFNFLFQSQTVNITLPINSTRLNNITLSVSLEGDGIVSPDSQNISFVPNILTNISFNLTIKNDAKRGEQNIYLKFKNGSIVYLEVIEIIFIENALGYSNFMFEGKVVPGNQIKVSLNLFNYLNISQDFNLLFSGIYIDDINISLSLNPNKIVTVSYSIFARLDINVETIDIEMSISTGSFEPKTITIGILPKFEIISIEFPSKVTQGVNPHLIIFIQNNLDSNEEFSLIINDDKVSTEFDELTPGENRIDFEIERIYNPYEFGIKSYEIEIEDESEDLIGKDYFEYELQISSFNLIVFYLIPLIIPISIILHYKNKDIKTKLLRR